MFRVDFESFQISTAVLISSPELPHRNTAWITTFRSDFWENIEVVLTHCALRKDACDRRLHMDQLSAMVPARQASRVGVAFKEHIPCINEEFCLQVLQCSHFLNLSLKLLDTFL